MGLVNSFDQWQKITVPLDSYLSLKQLNDGQCQWELIEKTCGTSNCRLAAPAGKRVQPFTDQATVPEPGAVDSRSNGAPLNL